MAIFSQHNNNGHQESGYAQSNNQSTETTVIGDGANIKGDFNFECHLHVDGELEGSINSSNMIVIGRRGRIKGELRADKLVVNGVFEGVAECNQVDVLADGVFTGDVVSKELTIEAKAKFQGKSRIKESDEENSSAPVVEPLENGEEEEFSKDL